MIFDSKISTEVSLSKILDTFILENEESKIIIAFLKQHDDNFKDILRYSLHYNRLFQLDLFLTCTSDDQDYIIKKLKDTSINDAAILTWQILKSNSYKAQHIKYKFRQELDWILKNGPKHPYSFGHEKHISPLDTLCFKLAESNNINALPNIVDNSKLIPYFKHISYSLFKNRLMQYDFVSTLDDISKYMFIKITFDDIGIDIDTMKCLSMQIFDSNEDFEVKRLCFDKLYSNIVPNHIIDDNILEIVYNCASFAELMLKLTIFNKEVAQHIVLYLLMFKIEWLKEWIEYDRKELDSYLNISDFVDKLLNYTTIEHKYA